MKFKKNWIEAHKNTFNYIKFDLEGIAFSFQDK